MFGDWIPFLAWLPPPMEMAVPWVLRAVLYTPLLVESHPRGFNQTLKYLPGCEKAFFAVNHYKKKVSYDIDIIFQRCSIGDTVSGHRAGQDIISNWFLTK